MWHGVVRMLYERTSRHGSAHPHLVERTDRGMTSSRVPWPVSFAVSAIHPFAVELMTGVVMLSVTEEQLQPRYVISELADADVLAVPSWVDPKALSGLRINDEPRGVGDLNLFVFVCVSGRRNVDVIVFPRRCERLEWKLPERLPVVVDNPRAKSDFVTTVARS